MRAICVQLGHNMREYLVLTIAVKEKKPKPDSMHRLLLHVDRTDMVITSRTMDVNGALRWEI